MRTESDIAPIPDFVDTIGGITFPDPFRALEEDSPKSVAWQDAQDRVAGDYLRGWEGFEPLRRMLRILLER